MLITQSKALKALKERTGRSAEWCQRRVKAIATERDGARLKLHDWKLEKLIEEANRPEPAAPRAAGVRPVSDRKIRQMMKRCV